MTNEKTQNDIDEMDHADLDELEYQVWLEMYGPVLALSQSKHGRGLSREMGYDHPNYTGAFATFDFDRQHIKTDSTRLKIERLREELADTRILFSIIFERISGKGKYLVLKYLHRGVIDLEAIVHDDLRACGRMYLRMLRISREIRELEGQRDKRQEARLSRMMARWE
jgi:hypothetical protein